jgi:hypothetical protein
MTSAWLWLYILTAAAIRLFLVVPLLLRVLPRVVDIDQHPVRSLGFLIAAISAGTVGVISAL